MEYPDETITTIQPGSFEILDSSDGFVDEVEIESIFVQESACNPAALYTDTGNSSADVAYGVIEDKPDCVYGAFPFAKP